MTPVDEDQVGVAILFYKENSPSGAHKYEKLLELFPDLQAKLHGSEFSSHVRGAGPFEQRVSNGMKGRVLLVGDAAGYLDPLTGEGIRLGLDGAKAIAQCLSTNNPQQYAIEHRRILRKYWIMTDGLLRLRRVPFLRKIMMIALKRIPYLFDSVISILAAD